MNEYHSKLFEFELRNLTPGDEVTVTKPYSVDGCWICNDYYQNGKVIEVTDTHVKIEQTKKDYTPYKKPHRFLYINIEKAIQGVDKCVLCWCYCYKQPKEKLLKKWEKENWDNFSHR